MKVLLINGSPHVQGNTYIALHEMEKRNAYFGREHIFSDEKYCTWPGKIWYFAKRTF